MIQFLKKWYNYLFKRNPFLSRLAEAAYVRKILCKLYLEHGKDVPYENYLLKVVPKSRCIYVEMKSRGCGYVFTREMWDERRGER